MSRHRRADTHRRAQKRRARYAVAVALPVAGVALLCSMWRYGHDVHQRAHELVAAAVRIQNSAAVHPGACRAPRRPAGAAELLRIDRLGLTAPIVAGVSDAALDEGVGHLPASSWPGNPGIVVLEAHDVSFFGDIDRLRPGDEIAISGPCRQWSYTVTAGRVVHAGDPLPSGTGQQLALVTCWPTTALFYTDRRYVVTAQLVAETEDPQHPAPAQNDPQPALPHIRAALPAGTDVASLTPTAAGIPMGKLHLAGRLSSRWRQSARPLEAATAGTQLFALGLDALRTGNRAAWRVIAPTVALPLPPSQWSSHPALTRPLDVNISGTGMRVSTVELRTRALAVTATAAHGVLHITAWQFVAPQK